MPFETGWVPICPGCKRVHAGLAVRGDENGPVDFAGQRLKAFRCGGCEDTIQLSRVVFYAMEGFWGRRVMIRRP